MDKGLIALVAVCVVGFLGFFIYATSGSASNSVANNYYGSGTAAFAGVQTGVREITVSTTNWAFSPSKIVVSKGERVKLTLNSLEGTHGLSLPDFGVNLVAAQGQSASAELVADKAGKFAFRCSVFCGQGHSEMTGELEVVDAAASQPAPTAAALQFQDVDIRGTQSGFSPKTVRVKAGQPVRISFTADGNAGCARAFLVKKAGISLLSKNGRTETAEFTPEKGTYEGKCSMSMFGMTIEAE